MRLKRPRYYKPARTNAGITSPRFVLHAALADLPQKFGTGTYLKGASEEALFTTISQDLLDSCLHALQERPPSVSLAFPKDPAYLPMITIQREIMSQQDEFIGDDAGLVEEEVDWITDATTLTPTGGAVGGETTLLVPCVGDLITTSTVLWLTRSGASTELDASAGDYTVDAATKTITLASALQAGDVVYAERYATYKLPGGDLIGNRFGFNYVIFVDTPNDLQTEVLSGIVWRELVAKHDILIAAGLQDMNFGFREMSPWTELQAPQGERTEVTVSGTVTWAAYKRATLGRTLDMDMYNIDGDEIQLEMSQDIVVYNQST